MRHEPIKAWLVALVVVGSWLLGAPGGASVFAQGLPTVYVQAYRPLGRLSHATPVAAENLIHASVAMPDAGLAVDWYVGLIAPDGRFLSFVGDPDAPTLAVGATPVPLTTEMTVKWSRYFYVRHTFTAAEPQGWYTLYGVVVRPGEPFSDPKKWIAASFFPILVRPAGVAGEGK